MLLVIGTPGTGKRAVGHYLEQQGGFEHLDFERAATRKRYLEGGTAALRARIDELADEGRGLVVTWAAGPVGQLRQIRRLQSLGFEPIWFDSDRGAACRAHFSFGAGRIARFHFVDPFDAAGTFRPLAAVAAELLARRPQIRPASLRELAGAALEALRPPRARSRRTAGAPGWRIVGGVAAGAGVAAAGVSLAIGLQGGSGRPAQVAAAGHAARAAIAALPRHGVLVSGRSLAGVELGDKMAQVRALWGPGQRLAKCPGCKPTVWYYSYPTGDPVGAGVQFSGGRVVAVFTLGGPSGWHTETGIRVGQVLENPFNDTTDSSVWKTCAGYSAKSTRTAPDAVTSILTQGASVYGFALTRPSVSPCE